MRVFAAAATAAAVLLALAPPAFSAPRSPPVSLPRRPPLTPKLPPPATLTEAMEAYYAAAQALQPTIAPPPPPITQGVEYFQLNVQAAAASLAVPLQAALSAINLAPYVPSVSAAILGSALDRGLTYRDFLNAVASSERLPQQAFNAKLNALVEDLVPVISRINTFLRSLQSGSTGRRLLATTADLQALIPGQTAGAAYYPFTQPRAVYDNFVLEYKGEPLYRRWGTIDDPTATPALLARLANLTDRFVPEVFTSKMVKAEPAPGCNATLRHAVVDLLADAVDFRAAQLGWTLDSALCCLDDARAPDFAIWMVYLEAGLLLAPLGIGIQPTGETTAWLCGGSGPGNDCSRLVNDLRSIWGSIRHGLCRE